MIESTTFNVFLFVGTVASILSLIVGLWKYRKVYQVLNVALVVGLTIFASYSFYNLQQIQAAEHAIERQKEIARKDAVALLEGMPSYISSYEPGESRGVALAVLAFLEQRKDLYPETLKLAQETVKKDIEQAQAHLGYSQERERMEVAAKAMLQMLRALAGSEGRRGNR